MAIGIQNAYIGGFTLNRIAKINEYQQQSGKFNIEQILKDINYMRVDDNVYLLVRGLRYLYRIQKKEECAANAITHEHLQQVVDTILKRVNTNFERKQYTQCLNLLASISDFHNKYFNYEQNEQNLNKIIKESFEHCGVKAAFLPFMNIAAGDRVAQSTKLANKMLKEFSKSQQGADLEKAYTYQFVKIMEKYASHGWMMA